MKKNIIAFTGNRAEYGLQYPIYEQLQNDNNFNFQLIVSGAHLDKKFGNSISEIKDDNIKIANIIKITAKQSQIDYTTRAISEVINGVSKVLKKVQPNYFLVYADRFESYGACIAATQMCIPTIHVEGGDLTLGGNLVGDNAKFNADKIINIFKGEDNDFSKAVCLNAAAGLIVNENHQNFAEAYNDAREHILSNKVIKHLEKIQNG